MNSWIKTAAVAAAVLSAPLVAQETLGSAGRGGGMAMLRMADTNGDGVITRDEIAAAADARFARRDHSGDGALDRTDRAMPVANGAPGASAAPARAQRNVTREQFRAGAMRRFDRLDTNHDGKIDATELAAAETLMRARRAANGEMPATPPPPQ